jgi:hypothetical protein
MKESESQYQRNPRRNTNERGANAHTNQQDAVNNNPNIILLNEAHKNDESQTNENQDK